MSTAATVKVDWREKISGDDEVEVVAAQPPREEEKSPDVARGEQSGDRDD
ncbi:MAG TPA: hypothetical protein PKK23_18870 [Nitrospirales bacterium]|nr:hypothetical protein [Nitrospirales bacterium]